MHRTKFAAILLLVAPVCLAQSSPAPAPAAASAAQEASAPKVVGHGAIPLTVSKTLDSNKLQAGDTVELPTAGDFILPGGTHVAKGAKVTAHVVKSESRSKGASDSELVLAFDSIALGGGNTQPVHGFIQAVGPNLDTSGPEDPMHATMGKQAGAGTGYQPDTIKSGSNTTKSGGSLDMLNAQSTGVHGVHNLDLSADGVLSSKGKNVKLDSGDQLIVKVELLQQ